MSRLVIVWRRNKRRVLPQMRVERSRTPVDRRKRAMELLVSPIQHRTLRLPMVLPVALLLQHSTLGVVIEALDIYWVLLQLIRSPWRLLLLLLLVIFMIRWHSCTRRTNDDATRWVISRRWGSSLRSLRPRRQPIFWVSTSA